MKTKSFKLNRTEMEYVRPNFTNTRCIILYSKVTWVSFKSKNLKYFGSLIQLDGEIDDDMICRVKTGSLKWR